jgi:hypothetical protein
MASVYCCTQEGGNTVRGSTPNADNFLFAGLIGIGVAVARRPLPHHLHQDAAPCERLRRRDWPTPRLAFFAGQLSPASLEST